ncbi:MAG: glycerol uptake facilitator-like aquaporin [Psychromonas sp.]|jgi:glycerol uptake facilitator-like aquaporin
MTKSTHSVMPPILVGLVAAVIGGSLGPLTDFAINLASDYLLTLPAKNLL